MAPVCYRQSVQALPLCVLAVWLAPAVAQRVDWTRVDINSARLNPRLRAAHLTPPQRRSVRRLLLADSPSEDSGCDGAGWVDGVSFYRAPLGRAGLVYASPGVGCMRGGQGANASLWLIDLAGPHPVLLAGSPQGFSGWGLGVQPHTSHGLHDFVTGWHNSAFSYTLTYYRFDGRHYRSQATQEITSCDKQVPEGDVHLCLENGRRARDSTRY